MRPHGRGFTLVDLHRDVVARLLDAVPEDQARRLHRLQLDEKDHPGLRLAMATQYFDALGRELQQAVRANVATVMLLQPSAADARLLRDGMAPLTERDLIYLPRFRMAVRTELEGATRVLTADVLPEAPSLGTAGLVRHLSDARDARLDPGGEGR